LIIGALIDTIPSVTPASTTKDSDNPTAIPPGRAAS
jgi:hypothetical protein